MLTLGTSLVVQRLLFCTSNAGGEGLSLVREISSYNVTQPRHFLKKGLQKGFLFLFFNLYWSMVDFYGLPWRFSGKESAPNTGHIGDVGSNSGLRRCPEEDNGNPLQYSCLENTMNRAA